MRIKHWKLNLLKEGSRITLFATTTDRTVEEDLHMETEKSLIQAARQYHRQGQTPEQNHRDLAVGALMSYAGAPPYDLTHEHIEVVPAVPERTPNCYIGGYDRASLVPVWEEHEADSAD